VGFQVISRRRALGALAAATLAAGFPTGVAMAAGVRRVGLFFLRPGATDEEGPRNLMAIMATLGYVEGKDVVYLRQYIDPATGPTPDHLASLAVELVKSGPEAIVTDGTAATGALARATSTIPIVTNVGDPVAAGFAKSLARPGGNVTGVTLASRETFEKELELLKSLIPGSWGIALIVGEHTVAAILPMIEDAARRNSIPLRKMSFRDQGEEDRELRRMRSQGIRAVAHIGYTATFAPPPILLEHGLTALFSQETGVARGALLSYEALGEDVVERKAHQLARILRGTSAAELPFEAPTRFRLAVNLRSAKTLGLKIPRDVLLRADKVYE
jgi:putative ABC transport system substrate-binding protein